MARITFNIGMLRSQHSKVDPMGALETVDILNAFSTLPAVAVCAYRIQQSATEPTLVLHADVSPWPATVGQLADCAAGLMACTLDQDAIAWYSPDISAGGLAGPRASEWGEFNEQYFLF